MRDPRSLWRLLLCRLLGLHRPTHELVDGALRWRCLDCGRRRILRDDRLIPDD